MPPERTPRRKQLEKASGSAAQSSKPYDFTPGRYDYFPYVAPRPEDIEKMALPLRSPGPNHRAHDLGYPGTDARKVFLASKAAKIGEDGAPRPGNQVLDSKKAERFVRGLLEQNGWRRVLKSASDYEQTKHDHEEHRFAGRSQAGTRSNEVRSKEQKHEWSSMAGQTTYERQVGVYQEGGFRKNLMEKDRQAHNKLISEGMKKSRDNMTSEQQQAEHEKRSEALKERWGKIDPEERLERLEPARKGFLEKSRQLAIGRQIQEEIEEASAIAPSIEDASEDFWHIQHEAHSEP